MSQNIYTLIRIDELSATPKYLQLANSIISAIDKGFLEKGELMPSINDLSFELDISRDTAEKAYKHLKKLKALGSVPGKGYFILKDKQETSFKLFLLFNKLSAHKKIIYDALTKSLGSQATIDLYIYHNDFALFKKIMAQRRADYTHYVIIPHFQEGGEFAHEIINTIPPEKLILLDKLHPGVHPNCAAVYENFEEDIFHALEQAKGILGKYKKIKIIFPEYTYYPEEIVTGCKKFCQEYAFSFRIVHDILAEPLNPGEVYISVMENDLVALVERLIAQGLKIGEDVGVISYNETPLKKIILNGITTISTDFQQMGELAAGLILANSNEKRPIPFYLTIRPSI